MAEPTAPTAPTPCDLTVSASKRTVTIANTTQLAAYFAGTYAGGPTWGDTVVLALGTYAPASPYTLPAYTAVAGTQTGSDYITFTSANASVLPPSGTTVSVADAVNMPTLVIPPLSAGIACFLAPDLASARNIRFVGLNFLGGSTSLYGLYLQQQVASTAFCQYIQIDRCLVHADPVAGAAGSAIALSGSHCAILNCLIYDWFNPSGGEPHGILIQSGAGPYKIHQNQLAIVGCGIFMGDSYVANVGVIPADLTITENYIHVPVADNPMGFLYNAGTAALNVAGNVVTLQGGGVTDSSWTDGSTYLVLTGPRNGNGFFTTSILISGINLDGANTIRLTSAWANDGSRGTSGLTYHITKWNHRCGSTHKNLLEIKHARRVKIEGNIFARSYDAQQNCALVFTQRGEDSAMTDVLVQHNLILDCPIAMDWYSRVIDGSGSGFSVTAINGSAGGLVTIHTSGRIDIRNHGGCNVEIRNVTGCTEANGIWAATRIDDTTITIPVTYLGVAWGGTASITTYLYGSPPDRFTVKNNLVLNVGSSQALLRDPPLIQSLFAAVTQNTNPILVATGGALLAGGNDALLSTTGTWAIQDFCFEHNTFVGPRLDAGFNSALNLWETNNNLSATDYKNLRWTLRNNILKACSKGPSAGPSIAYYYASTNLGSPVYGTTALDRCTDSGRNFLYNIFFNSYNAASDYATLSGTDDDLLAMFDDEVPVGFTSYTGEGKADIANFILRDLYTTGTCSVTNGATTVNFGGGASLPTTIVKGVPLKGPDGVYYMVQARVNATQLTLQTPYLGVTNASGSYILGFRGWSSDGSDPGCNLTTLATAIAFAGLGGSGGGSGSTTGAAGLTGGSPRMGLAMTPQTP